MSVQYLQSTVSTFKSLQSFNSLDQLNESIKITFQNFKSILTKSSIRVLAHIAKYSVKYLGVSFLSKQSIANALDVDIRTVRRCIRQLEDSCLVKSYRLKRVNNDRRETSSAIVIQPLISVLPVCPSKETSYKHKNINNTDVTEAPAQSELVKILVNKLPKPLQVLQYYFSMEEIYSIVGTVYKAKSSVDKGISIEEHSFEFENTLKQVIQSYKLNRIRNLNGVVFGAIKKLCTSITLKSSMSEMFGL